MINEVLDTPTEGVTPHMCEWCGSTAIHNLSKQFNNGMMLCRMCYSMRLQGMKICKVCRQLYHLVRYTKCLPCFMDEVIELFKSESKPLSVYQISTRLRISPRDILRILNRLKRDGIVVEETIFRLRR